MISINKDAVWFNTTNSSISELLANQTFTGVSQDTSHYVKIILTVQTDVPSATDGIKLEFSNDEITWSSITNTLKFNTVSDNYSDVFIFTVKAGFFKLSYTNGPTDQKYFSFQTCLKRFINEDKITTPISVVKDVQESTAVRIVSDFKKDIAMGLVEYNKNFNVNGARYSVGNTETILTNIINTEYQWPTTAQRVRIKAGGSVNDTLTGTGAKAIQINGLDSNYLEISEVVMTNGSSASSWTTKTFIRINSVITVSSGTTKTNEGTIIIENETDNYELSAISPKFGRALSCVYTVPAGNSCVISRVLFMTSSNASITLRGYFREFSTNTKYIINFMPGLSGVTESTQQNYIKFNPKTDFWATAEKITGEGNADASIIYELDILKID